MIDWTKPLEWEAGKRPARYLGTLGGLMTPKYRHVIAVDYPSMEQIRVVDDRGFDESNWTVVNAPEPEREIVRWVNVYPSGPSAGLHPDKAAADAWNDGNTKRIACVPVTIKYRPGDGL